MIMEFNMSIDESGIVSKVLPRKMTVEVKSTHPLIALANVLPWDALAEMVVSDLKITTKKGKWWMGRPLRLRIHLGAYLLQQLHNLTDRELEYAIKDNAAYQLFCGKHIVKQWHYPDHTKIETFRSRLSAETQRKLANKIATQAAALGFCDPRHIDIDSTVQEANMRYPVDSSLLCKLGAMAKRAADYMNEQLYVFKFRPMVVNLKLIKGVAKTCFFISKIASKEEKTKKLQQLLDCVNKEVGLVIRNARSMGQAFVEEMPWNIKRIFVPLIEKSEKYLSDVKTFIHSGDMVKDKILSFHLNNVSCITKNKPGKKYQFGRMFQLGRVKGNFLFAGKSKNPNQSDKQSIELMLNAHDQTFGNKKIVSAATDKGYYSVKNEHLMKTHGIEEIGIQRPSNIKQRKPYPLPAYRENELIDRRAGIEPLIGHAKQGGQLGRSRMKSDSTIEASGFASILGFNLRQITRYSLGKITMEAT